MVLLVAGATKFEKKKSKKKKSHPSFLFLFLPFNRISSMTMTMTITTPLTPRPVQNSYTKHLLKTISRMLEVGESDQDDDRIPLFRWHGMGVYGMLRFSGTRQSKAE